jgi:CheY-like chemotaxis protein
MSTVALHTNTQPLLILLAEDDPGHGELIQRNLRRSGFLNEVVHVTDGRQALDFIEAQGKFSGRELNSGILLLLDINMPQIDGVEVLRRLKANPRTEKIPVIMLTTTDDPREIDRCYQLGCSAFITKPVAYEPFIETVRRLGLFLQVVTVLPEDESWTS